LSAVGHKENKMDEKKCKDKVRGKLRGQVEDLEKLWKLYQVGDESDPDLGTFNEYGLCFDYVAPGTFGGQKRGYFRYQLSWGGPSDEFRFFTDEGLRPVRIEYWFLDWFDGAKITLKEGSRDDALLREIWGFFEECGSVKAELDKARS